MPRGRESCAYCDEPNAETRDHIPPRNLFPKPRPSDLISVPCCEKCRAGWSADDEYFRLAVVSTENVSKHEAVERVNETISKSLRKSVADETSQGFARLVYESLIEVKGKNSQGEEVAAGVMKIDRSRIKRVANRIIRGLFYLENHYPVPVDYVVETEFSQTGFPQIFTKIEPLLDHFSLPRIVGNGVFAYSFATVEEDSDSTIWLLSFYEALPFIGFVIKPQYLR